MCVVVMERINGRKRDGFCDMARVIDLQDIKSIMELS